MHRHMICGLFVNALLFASVACMGQTLTPSQASVSPWHVRAVIVATFEGKYRLWGQHENLSETVTVPGVDTPLHSNPEHTVLGMVSGTSLVNASESMMALGLDPQFDLAHAYFIINGIAGVDPQDASSGSAAWADIDIREAPTAASLTTPHQNGGKLAFETAWLCGSTVLHAILEHWNDAYEHIPNA